MFVSTYSDSFSRLESFRRRISQSDGRASSDSIAPILSYLHSTGLFMLKQCLSVFLSTFDSRLQIVERVEKNAGIAGKSIVPISHAELVII
jgi:hypothetical protein